MVIEWADFLERGLPDAGGEVQKTAVTIGVFDGVHRGHQALIGRIAARPGAVPMVITFRQNYKKFLRYSGGGTGSGESYLGDILTLRQKLSILESLGAAIILVIDFSEVFRRMPGAAFIRLLLERGRMAYLAVGSNFRCGYHADTGAADIPALTGGFSRSSSPPLVLDLVEPLVEAGAPISSSRIRSLIAAGRLAEAAALLGRPFALDIQGARPVPGLGELMLDLAGQGRALPPPGTYPVILRGAAAGTCPPRRAKVLVEAGGLRLPLSGEEADTRWEYAEFLV